MVMDRIAVWVIGSRPPRREDTAMVASECVCTMPCTCGSASWIAAWITQPAGLNR